MARYRISIIGTQFHDKPFITFTCTVQKETAPGTWEPLLTAPANFQILTGDLQNILHGSASDEEKRAQLVTMIRSHALASDALINDQVIDELEALLPAGWPVNIILEGML
jgi:hypothetical protein